MSDEVQGLSAAALVVNWASIGPYSSLDQDVTHMQMRAQAHDYRGGVKLTLKQAARVPGWLVEFSASI